MWKESYKLGVEELDEQHKSLCDMVESLIRIIKGDEAEAKKQECIKAILFMKDYVVKHFATEEAYMTSVNYDELEKHKMLHTVLGRTVTAYEKKMVDSDFSVTSIKEFVGFVTAWLTYHMAVEDMKITNRNEPIEQVKKIDSYLEGFAQSSRTVIEEMAKITVEKIQGGIQPSSADDIRIIIRQFKPYKYEVVFYFNKKVAFGLIEALSSMRLDFIDELAISTLTAISSTINRRAQTLFSADLNEESASIFPIPKVLDNSTQLDHTNGFYFETEIGRISVSIKC